jgi:hypothetical protein
VISLVSLSGAAGGGAIAAAVVEVMTVMTVVMVSDKRHVKIIRSQVDGKRRGCPGRESNGGQCGNPKNSSDLSHIAVASYASE